MRAYPATDCACLIEAVRRTEVSFRPIWIRMLEWLTFAAAVIARGAVRGELPDLSLGPYQIRLSTAAAFSDIELARVGRRILPGQARKACRAASAALVPARAKHFAARRIGEALQFGRRDGLSVIASVARTYAGELPSSLCRPYAARLDFFLQAPVQKCTRGCSLRCT